MVSRISRTISWVVLGCRKAKRATVSPSHVVGVTKPIWSASSLADHVVVVALRPAGPAEEDHGQVRVAHQLGVGQLLNDRGGPAGDGQPGLHGVAVGVGAVDGQGEPQRQPPGPPGQVVGVVARIPLLRVVGVEHVEVRRRPGCARPWPGWAGGRGGRRSRRGRTATCGDRR